MKLTDAAEISTARMQAIDQMFEAAGVPTYTQMWTTNAQLQAERDRLIDRCEMANVALSKTRGDLLQAEMIIGTAASVAQIKRQLARMKDARDTLERSQHERFDQRWGRVREPGR